MTRFNRDFRRNIASRVCRHYDKYCEFTNPVEFNVLEDVYKVAFKRKHWEAMNLLLDSKFGKQCLYTSGSFELMVSGDKKWGSGSRTHITFPFPDDKPRPGMRIEFDKLAPEAYDRIAPWVRKAVAYKKLRRVLHARVHSLFNCDWDKYKAYDSYTGNHRGGPTPGTGCNTPGQVYRMWPELMAFMPADIRDKVRGASTKSRLPTYFRGYGNPQQFLTLEKYEQESDEELLQDRRMFEALTHILVQMSLMTDVPGVPNYPSVYIP